MTYEGLEQRWTNTLDTAEQNQHLIFVAVDGKRVKTREIERGGVRLDEVAYGWADISAL